MITSHDIKELRKASKRLGTQDVTLSRANFEALATAAEANTQSGNHDLLVKADSLISWLRYREPMSMNAKAECDELVAELRRVTN